MNSDSKNHQTYLKYKSYYQFYYKYKKYVKSMDTINEYIPIEKQPIKEEKQRIAKNTMLKELPNKKTNFVLSFD